MDTAVTTPAGPPVGLTLAGCNSSVLYLYGPHTFRLLRGGRLISVVDIDAARAREACALLGAQRWHTDFEQALEDDAVEAAVLATPGWLHEPQTVAAARAGKHVLCEKPMARTVEECDRMIAACEDAGVTLMIAHMKRFHRAFRKVRELIEGGVLGDVFAVRGQWDEPARDLGADGTFRGDPRSLGGQWHDHGAHMSDLACWWLDSPAKRVNGVIRSVGEHMIAAEDFAIATLDHENGAVSCHQTTTQTYRPWYETYEVMGNRGTLLVQATRHTSLSFEPPTLSLYDQTEGHFNARVVDVTPYLGFEIDRETQAANQFLQELEHFCGCVRLGKEPLVTAAMGRHAVEIINAAYLSHFRGAWVDLPLRDSGELADCFRQYRETQRRRRGHS